MFQTWRSWRFEVCWSLLLLALALTAQTRASSQGQEVLCDIVADAQMCDQDGSTCVCEGDK